MANIFNIRKSVSGSNAPVLPKINPVKEKYEGSIRVIEAFNHKSEVNQSDYIDELAPDRPFVQTLNAINIYPNGPRKRTPSISKEGKHSRYGNRLVG